MRTEQTLESVAPELFSATSVPNLSAFMNKVVEDVQKSAKVKEKPPETDDNSLHFVEALTLETEKGAGRLYLTKWVRQHSFLICT